MFLDKNDVRRAFGADEFFPFFQPIVDLRTGQLTGFEALARWNHARLGAIAPDAFIPIVQKSGLIDTLTQLLLDKILAAAPLLPGSLRLSINLSSLQLLDVTLPARIATSAVRAGFPLERLTIELTEAALLEDLPRAQAVAGDLKALRCRLSLDGLGAGHFGLFHLEDLPFDELKVDRRIVYTMTQSRLSAKIVAAIMGLGRSMGIATVAKGVETAELAEMLKWLGCDLGQGFLFGRPASIAEIPRMVSEPPVAWTTFFPAPGEEEAMCAAAASTSEQCAAS
jgi:EAL domain-containing protein (putative c-di-GMP-specific phosphodiesterase class I)